MNANTYDQAYPHIRGGGPSKRSKPDDESG